MRRIIYAIRQGWKNRRFLQRFLHERACRVTQLSEITPQRLDEANIAVLVLDFDGVLAWHGAPTPLPEVAKWLSRLAMHIGEQRIALLTNKPQPARLAYFQKHFPSLYIAHGVRKKPYPDGLLQIAEYKGIDCHRLVLLDDRLLTGMLATCLASCRGWYFTNPYRSLWRHPLTELSFSTLRVIERCALKCVRG